MEIHVVHVRRCIAPPLGNSGKVYLVYPAKALHDFLSLIARYWFLGIMSLTLGLATFYTLSWLQLKPGRSVARASAGCNQLAWIHVSTTPFYVLWRDAGAMFGLGVATQLQPATQRLAGQRCVLLLEFRRMSGPGNCSQAGMTLNCQTFCACAHKLVSSAARRAVALGVLGVLGVYYISGIAPPPAIPYSIYFTSFVKAMVKCSTRTHRGLQQNSLLLCRRRCCCCCLMMIK